jgi:O-antigen/teichoic acid export membrane protein
MLTKIKKKFNFSEAISGSIVISFGNTFEQAFRFLRNIILTRLLVPEIFGIMAIVLAITQATLAFTNIGINYAIIQNKQGKREEFLNIAFWLSVLRGVGLYSIMFILAPYISDFYNNPELTQYLRIVFLGTLFGALLSPRAHILVKEMQFKKWIIIQNFGGILSVIITLFLAYYLKNIWALVIGFTFESFNRMILSYILCPYKPSLKFDKDMNRELITFAKGMIGLGILYFIFHRGEIFVIGKLCTKYELGLYHIALSLAYVPYTFLGAVLEKVGLPKFSKIQDDNEKINDLLIKLTKMLTYFIFPFLFLVLIFSADALGALYGSKYAAVAFPFFLACTVIVLRLIGLPITQVYFAKGKPELHRYFSGLRTIIFVILVYPFTKYFGLVGAPISSLIAMLIGFSYQIYRMKIIFPFEMGKYFMIFIKPIMISFVGLLFWYFIDYNFSSIYVSSILSLIVLMAIYLILFQGPEYFKKFLLVVRR